jgi:hypothetical protein
MNASVNINNNSGDAVSTSNDRMPPPSTHKSKGKCFEDLKDKLSIAVETKLGAEEVLAELEETIDFKNIDDFESELNISTDFSIPDLIDDDDAPEETDFDLDMGILDDIDKLLDMDIDLISFTAQEEYASPELSKQCPIPEPPIAPLTKKAKQRKPRLTKNAARRIKRKRDNELEIDVFSMSIQTCSMQDDETVQTVHYVFDWAEDAEDWDLDLRQARLTMFDEMSELTYTMDEMNHFSGTAVRTRNPYPDPILSSTKRYYVNTIQVLDVQFVPGTTLYFYVQDDPSNDSLTLSEKQLLHYLGKCMRRGQLEFRLFLESAPKQIILYRSPDELLTKLESIMARSTLYCLPGSTNNSRYH